MCRYTVDWVDELLKQAEHFGDWSSVQLCRSLAEQQGVPHDKGGREDCRGIGSTFWRRPGHLV